MNFEMCGNTMSWCPIKKANGEYCMKFANKEFCEFHNTLLQRAFRLCAEGAKEDVNLIFKDGRGRLFFGNLNNAIVNSKTFTKRFSHVKEKFGFRYYCFDEATMVFLVELTAQLEDPNFSLKLS